MVLKVNSINVNSYDLFLENYSHVITGYMWRDFNGFYLPYLKFFSPLEEIPGAFPLYGHHIFQFGEKKICTRCGYNSVYDPYETVCESCKETDDYKRYLCLHEGMGVPFGKTCTLENPACGLSAWASKICYSDYVIYIAQVFNQIKVGISRRNREDASDGFYYRLLEQGADFAVVLTGNINLGYALQIESEIAKDYHIVDRVHFLEKVENLFPLDFKDEIRTIADTIFASYKTVFNSIVEIDFSNVWDEPPEFFDRYEQDPSYINGDLIFAKGNLVAFKDRISKEIIVYNLNKLSGKTIMEGGL